MFEINIGNQVYTIQIIQKMSVMTSKLKYICYGNILRPIGFEPIPKV